MKTLELTIPPPIVMIVIGAIMWLLHFLFPAFALSSISSLTGAAIVGLTGISVSMAGISSFKRAHTTTNPRSPTDTSTLVTTGIYNVTRNPMYLGVLLVLIGWGLFLGNVLALLCAFIFVPYITRYQIQPEERLLQEKFGETFTAYTTKVRRWI